MLLGLVWVGCIPGFWLLQMIGAYIFWVFLGWFITTNNLVGNFLAIVLCRYCRISAGAPMIGVQNFSWAVQHNKYHARVESIPLVFAAAAADLHQNKHHQAHAIDAYVVETVWRKLLPGLLNSYDAPYSLPSIAPRPLIIVNGELDPRCPIAGLEVAIKSAKAVYDRCEAGDKLQWYVEKGTGHQCTESMWRVTESFLDECLLA